MADDGKNNQYLQNFILGFADGLTVPFALTAGLSSLGNHKYVITAGLAELFSGSISMGLGAYLAAITDRQRYQVQSLQLQNDDEKTSARQRDDLMNILCSYGVSRGKVEEFISELCQDRTRLIQFVMDFQIRLEQPRRREAYISAVIMGLAYFIGGLLPMIPYFATQHTMHALIVSICITAIILVAFGFLKAKYVGCTAKQSLQSAALTLGIGAAAAGASYGIVRGVQRTNPL